MYTMDEYQKQAAGTAVYPGRLTEQGVDYCTFKLSGEAGEVSEKRGKLLRGDFTRDEYRTMVIKELGDVLWYVANLALELGISLDDVARLNLEKLQDRKARGVLKGTGDAR